MTPGAPPPGAIPVSTDVAGTADAMIVGTGTTPQQVVVTQPELEPAQDSNITYIPEPAAEQIESNETEADADLLEILEAAE